MTRPTLLLAGLLVVLALAPSTRAQGAPTLQRVVLTDGTVLIGFVQDETDDPIVVVAENGVEQRVARARVAEITDLFDGQFTRYDPARTRLFFSPTARSLGAGAKRFSAYYLLGTLAVGVTDRVDVSVGSTVPFVSSEGSFVGLNANAKATIVQSGQVAVALGTSASVPLATDAGTTGVLGTLYGVATVGSEATAVTLGAYGFYTLGFDADAELANGTALLVGLEKQISDRFKLVSENYAVLAFGEETVFDGRGGQDTTRRTTEALFGTLSGVRFFGDRLAADIAVALGAYEGSYSTVPIPYLGLSYTF